MLMLFYLFIFFYFLLFKSWQHRLTKQQQSLLVCALSVIKNCERCVYILCGLTDWSVPWKDLWLSLPPPHLCVFIIGDAENLGKENMSNRAVREGHGVGAACLQH